MLIFKRRLLTALLALVVVLAGCTAIERAYLPSPILADARFAEEGAARDVDHSAWGAFLAAHVSLDGAGIARIDYGAIDPVAKAALDRYVAELETIEVSALARDAQLAYWINLYNAVTVRVVAEHYPVRSIRAIRLGGPLSVGPWGKPLVTVEGRALSLNDIEHKIVRPVFRELRIHYALNCAAAGCPNLGREPYAAASLEAQLDAAARAYVNDPRGVTVDAEGRLVLSKIYVWFKEDFDPAGRGSKAAILAHLGRYADPGLASRLGTAPPIAGYRYDWSLNDRAAR